MIHHLFKDPTDCVLVVKSSTGQNHDQSMRRQFSSDTFLTQVGVTFQFVIPEHVDEHLGHFVTVVDHLKALLDVSRLSRQQGHSGAGIRPKM